MGRTKVYLISYSNYKHLIFVLMSATIEMKLLKPNLNTQLGTVNYTSILALAWLNRRWVCEEQIVWAQSGLHSKAYYKKNHFKAGLSQLSWHKFKVWRQNLEGNVWFYLKVFYNKVYKRNLEWNVRLGTMFKIHMYLDF